VQAHGDPRHGWRTIGLTTIPSQWVYGHRTVIKLKSELNPLAMMRFVVTGPLATTVTYSNRFHGANETTRRLDWDSR
jgi:hypothetical protein